MFKTLTATLSALMIAAAPAAAYDADKAAQFDAFFSKFTQKAFADSKLFVPAEEVMKMLNASEPFVLLDIRTSGETGVVALNTPNTLTIPLSELFDKANLDRLPTDRPVLIVCYNGTRAAMAAVGLLNSGIKNIRVVKGGIVALAAANSVKNAPMKALK